MRRFLLFCTMTTTLAAFAATNVVWLEESYDFGTFLEANGPQTGRVRFVNSGPEPTIINRVRPSCGCTGESHSEGIIAVGDTATIFFTYNPVGRPGRFEKTVKVFYGEENAMKVIPISGTVIGTPETLSTDYPVEAGALRLSEDRITAGAVNFGKARNLFIRGYNQSNDTIHPAWSCDNPAISIGISTPAVPPGDVVSFSIYFNSRDIRQPGPLTIPVTFRPETGAQESVTIPFVADVLTDSSTISAMAAKNGPRIILAPELLDLGIVRGNKTLHKEIVIINEGNSDLEIKRVYCDRDGIKATRYPTHIAPGKKFKISLSIDLSKIPDGPSASMLDVYSNDPVHPIKSVRIAILKE